MSYKILVVDDEILVRTNIKMLLDTKSSDFALAGEAKNGREALDFIRNHPVDIVIADMKMPVMDGLTFSKLLREKYPEMVLVVLSNYDDYEYVRGTLKNGAIDYILKHDLDRAVLDAALRKAVQLCGKQKTTHAENVHFAENNIIALRRKVIVQLLTGFLSDESEIRYHFQTLGIRLDLEKILPIIMQLEKDAASEKSLRTSSLTQYGVLNITQEIIDDTAKGILCDISDNMFCILLSFAGISEKDIINDRVNTLLWRIESSLKQFINLSVHFSVGELCESYADLPSAYEKAEHFSANLPFFNSKSVVRVNDDNVKNRVMTGLDIKREKELFDAVTQRDETRIQTLIGTIFTDIKKDNLDFTSSRIVFTDILSIITQICKKNGIELSTAYANSHIITDIINIWDLKTAEKWFIEIFHNVVEKLPVPYEKSMSSYIKATIVCINRDFGKNISEQSVANDIGISVSYLSTLFRQEMNCKFSQYLNDFRLEKAKSLFESGEISIQKVSQLCGFYDYTYFFKLFKKKYGITPKNFIKRQG